MILMYRINKCFFISKTSCWYRYCLLLPKLNKSLLQRLIGIMYLIGWLFRLLLCRFNTINLIFSFFLLILILIILILSCWTLWFLWFQLIRLRMYLLLWMLVQSCLLGKKNIFKPLLLCLVGSLEKLNL